MFYSTRPEVYLRAHEVNEEGTCCPAQPPTSRAGKVPSGRIGFPFLSGRNRCVRISKYGLTDISLNRVTQRHAISLPLRLFRKSWEFTGSQGSHRRFTLGMRSFGGHTFSLWRRLNDCRDVTGVALIYLSEFLPQRMGLVLFTLLVTGNHVIQSVIQEAGQRGADSQSQRWSLGVVRCQSRTV